MAKDNQEAIRSAFDRHFDEVYGYVVYRLAPDRAAAEDLVQDVFLAALAGWDSYRGEGVRRSLTKAKSGRRISASGRIFTSQPMWVERSQPVVAK